MLGLALYVLLAVAAGVSARLDRETARGFMSMVSQFERECFLVRRRRRG